MGYGEKAINGTGVLIKGIPLEARLSFRAGLEFLGSRDGGSWIYIQVP